MSARMKTRARKYARTYGKPTGVYRRDGAPRGRTYSFMVLEHAEALDASGHATLLYRAYPDGTGQPA